MSCPIRHEWDPYFRRSENRLTKRVLAVYTHARICPPTLLAGDMVIGTGTGTGAVQPEFFARNTVIVARDLIGQLLVRDIEDIRYVSIIVETEAYREDDPASHSFRGPTNRNRVMFGPPGFAYMYRSYGVHHCLNVVTEDEGRGCAVLIRAVEPIGELGSLWRRRFPASVFDPRRAKLLTNGPGKLTQAYAITVDRFNGHPFDASPLRIVAPVDKKARTVVSDVRIGISHGKEKVWRFVDTSSEYISRSVTHR